jgi:hypothetical protein
MVFNYHHHISESSVTNFWVKNTEILCCGSGSGIRNSSAFLTSDPGQKFGSQIRSSRYVPCTTIAAWGPWVRNRIFLSYPSGPSLHSLLNISPLLTNFSAICMLYNFVLFTKSIVCLCVLLLRK